MDSVRGVIFDTNDEMLFIDDINVRQLMIDKSIKSDNKLIMLMIVIGILIIISIIISCYFIKALV